MKIGILETGPVPETLEVKHGTYPSMFERMLTSVDPSMVVTSYRVIDNVFPKAPSDHDGWIITGSRHGVYEDHPWIAPLETFIQNCAAARIPMAGFCFGHQILAQALGGKVVKSAKGWGLGVQTYDASHSESWLGHGLEDFSAIAVHQDQITQQPPDTTVMASSEFCEFAALAYGNPKEPYAISVQPHPEFSPEFVEDLISERRGSVFESDLADAALKTLSQPVSNSDWAKWVVAFFHATKNRINV